VIDDSSSRASWSRTASRSEDFDRPTSARVYDFLLGGSAHGAVDRDLGRELILAEPFVVAIARENRSFLRRAVTVLVEAGIDQFLDLGSGIPTVGSTHEVARRIDPSVRVAYVDIDPVAVAHGELLLAQEQGLTASWGDLRDPEAVLAAPGVAGLLDLSRPVALLMFSVLQHVPDTDDPTAIVRRYLSRLAAGSALALSHLTGDEPRIDTAALRRLTEAYPRGSLTPRSLDDVAAMVAGVELLDPGLVYAAQWRPEHRLTRGPLREPCCGHRAAVGFLPPGPPRP
jgi:hypothetical protein